LPRDLAPRMPRRPSYRDARCLVTGASTGIGRALAAALVADGARVVLAARSADRLDAAARDLVARGARPDALLPVAADLPVADDRRRIFDAVAARLGALDLMVNKAGVGAYGRFESHDESVARRVFEVNVFALIEMCRGALPLLCLGDRPALVNMG